MRTSDQSALLLVSPADCAGSGEDLERASELDELKARSKESPESTGNEMKGGVGTVTGVTATS
jgi:hypothetical protein